MSARAWLDSRGDGVPDVLAARVSDVVDRHDAKPVFDALVAGALSELTAVLAADPMTRAQAVPLLTADALVTHALDAAADEPATLGARADAAMEQIAMLRART